MQKWFSIHKNWQKYLNEQQKHFIVHCTLKYEKDFEEVKNLIYQLNLYTLIKLI